MGVLDVQIRYKGMEEVVNLLIVTPNDFRFLAADAPRGISDLRPLLYHAVESCDMVIYREAVGCNHIIKDRVVYDSAASMDDVELLVLLADEMAKEEAYVEESSSNIVAHSSLIGFVNQRDPNECGRSR